MRTIIVTHNSEKEIEECLKTHSNEEIYVIDNHSNDKTCFIVFEYSKKCKDIHLIQMLDGNVESSVQKYCTENSTIINL